MALRTVVEELDQAVFGIRLYMVRDRDGLSDADVADLEKHPRFRCLPRRNIENYLLDEEILSEVATQFYLAPALRDVSSIAVALHEAAQATLMLALLASVREWVRMRGSVAQPAIKNVRGLSLDEFTSQLATSLSAARDKVNADLDEAAVAKFTEEEHARLTASIADGSWRRIFPGKQLFAHCCGDYWHHEAARVREAYADICLTVKPAAFSELSVMFDSFNRLP